MSVTARPFGATSQGAPVTCFRLENGKGSWAEVLDYGATLRAVAVPDREGALRDVCLGFDRVADYEAHDAYLGALVGRCANRIRGAAFQLNGETCRLFPNQESGCSLHGGRVGFDPKMWWGGIQGESVVLTLDSPDGEEGYPGALHVQVRYALTEEDTLCLELQAVSDADTVVNLTSHAYWDLNGHGAGDVGGHLLEVDGDAITELGADCCPTGAILPVEGTPFDLRTPRPLREGWDAPHPQIQVGGGYDHNWALRGEGLRRAAVLSSPESGITLEVSTTQPGLQVYTANFLPSLTGKGGAAYGRRGAVALEAQGFPNAVNLPQFPSSVLRKGERYRQEIRFAFSHS